MFSLHFDNLQPQQAQAIYNGLMTQPMGLVEPIINVFRQQIGQQEAAMKAQLDATIQPEPAANPE
jgi:hypothetical protein